MQRPNRIGTDLLLCLALMVWPIAAATAFQPDWVSQTAALISQAKEQGLNYLNTRDNKAKDIAKKNLEKAEKQLKDYVKKQNDCERCFELLAETYLYRAYFGFSKDYDNCVETAQKGLQLFPNNYRLALLKGYAHYNCEEYDQALRALNRYVMTTTDDEATKAQARQVQNTCQDKFLTNWNRQANFYQSKESRIEGFNSQTNRMEVVFQITPEYELNLGSQGFAAITQQKPPYNDPEIQTYLQTLVDKLVAKNPGSNFAYKVTVLNSPEVNAVTPPGHIIVYTGLLAFADNESELAAVMSHELAHNYAHHQGRAAIKEFTTRSIAGAILQAVNPQGAIQQTIAQLSATIGLNLIMRAYSRFEEKEADHYGAHILYNAGYDPTAFSMVFAKMYKMSPKQPIKFLSTHPPAPDRAAYMIDYVEAFPIGSTEVKTDSAEFKQIKAKVMALMPSAMQQKTPGKGVIPPLPWR
ncbi:MAG: M48 family metalloprotease [Acidobacteria bacterium]|nr:M48 family metalloprotease [Acidobacteriota bacterium]